MLAQATTTARVLALCGYVFSAVAAAQNAMPEDEHAGHQGMHHEMDHSKMDHSAMQGMLGAPMSQEASGTSWQPQDTPMMGRMKQLGDWHVMLHGYLDAVYDKQGGPRGDSEVFGAGMLMGMGQRPLASGTFGLRAMLAPDPMLMGKDGYPLLLQTGETADGVEPLVDRQHPHDLLMEVAASWSRPLSEHSSGYIYLGLPGEPALGPTAFMHRFSGVAVPEAPLSHHWLDSSHITFGVATLGYVRERWKIEASAFNGREPDEDRYDVEVEPLDSSSVRFSYNPTPQWAMQVSYGYLREPEQLEPGVNLKRTSASVSHHRAVGAAQWQTTLAWGRNEKDHGAGTTHAYLLESALNWRQSHTFFGRLENVDKDELFDHDDPRHGRPFDVSKLSVGYEYSWPLCESLRLGVGGLVSVYRIPRAIEADYGSDPTSYMTFVRLMLQ